MSWLAFIGFIGGMFGFLSLVIVLLLNSVWPRIGLKKSRLRY